MAAVPVPVTEREIDDRRLLGIDEEGFVGAELVVEIRSPGDDSYKKLPLYMARGVAEVMVIHQHRGFEIYRPNLDGQPVPVKPGDDGVVRSCVLDVGFPTVDGPRLRVTWDGGSAEV